MLKQNRDSPIEIFVKCAKAPLLHIFYDHTLCGEWCLAKKSKNEGKTYVHEDGWLCKEKHEKKFTDLGEITTKYGSVQYLEQSCHFFSTQVNEALNTSMICLSPKQKVFHATKSYQHRHSIMVATHNWGYERFWTYVLEKLGIGYSEMFASHLSTVSKKRKMWKQHHSKFDTKRKRRHKQNAQIREQIYEQRTGPEYQAGIGLDIGNAEAPIKKKCAKRTKCRCGATDHLTARSKK